MTLGSGALHSERNGSDTEPMRFLQFWILPDEASLEPSIEQRQFTKEDRSGRLLRVIGGDPPAVSVHQDATAYVASLVPGDEVLHDVDEGRAAYLYLIAGGVRISDGEDLATGDAVKVFGPEALALHATADSELILVEVPAAYTPVGVWAGRG
jgi:redox-sensitive bicupin YhaK (pirin superfamily)